LAGKHSWDPITLTVKDDVTNEVVRAIGSQLQKQVDHANQYSARSGGGYKFEMLIENLDGSEETLDTWTLGGCYIQNVNYGENNYSTSDPLNITIAIKYDNANHEGQLEGTQGGGDLSTGG
jgi:hypothetical protein